MFVPVRGARLVGGLWNVDFPLPDAVVGLPFLGGLVGVVVVGGHTLLGV